MQEFDSSKPPVVAGICDPKKYLTQLKYLNSEYLILKLKNNLALIFIIHFEIKFLRTLKKNFISDAPFDNLENNKYYEFKKLRVQKFMNEHLLKSTETTGALAIENSGIQVTDDETVEPKEAWIQAKVVKKDMKMFSQTSMLRM